MIIYRSLDEITAPLTNPVVTIGNFDGVHLGHREIFRRVKREAAELNGVSVIITFSPHPLRVVAAQKSITLINTLEEKITLIDASGVDYLLIIPFDATFAELSATEFVKQVLVEKLGIKRLIIGYDYAFGRKREGDLALLRLLGEQFQFSVDELSPIAVDGTVYSSSLIRRLIAEGDVAGAIKFLGRNYSVAGQVVHGHHRGVGLGFPTANIATDKELIPAEGVYAVKVKVDDQLFDGACNIGSNPTFANTGQSIEVHLLDFSGNIYGKEIRIYFFARLRGEKRFAATAELAAAVAADIEQCRRLLANAQLVAYREYLEGV